MLIATKSDKIDLSSEEKTQNLAIKFSKKLKLGDIVFLYGEIGVGKTTFIKYLINEFQKRNKLKITEITSPTFNLLNEYQIGKIKLNHYDLFRLKSPNEAENLNIFDNKLNVITLIDWPQMIKKRPENLIEINLDYESDHKRRSAKVRGINL